MAKGRDSDSCGVTDRRHEPVKRKQPAGGRKKVGIKCRHKPEKRNKYGHQKSNQYFAHHHQIDK